MTVLHAETERSTPRASGFFSSLVPMFLVRKPAPLKVLDTETSLRKAIASSARCSCKSGTCDRCERIFMDVHHVTA